jgi:HAMP domain-containing protein
MSSRDVGFLLRFIIPLILLGVLISFGETTRDPGLASPPRWALGLRILEFSRDAAHKIPYFWSSLSEPKSSVLFGAVGVFGTLLLSLTIWLGMKELRMQSSAEAETQEETSAENSTSVEAVLSAGLSFRWKLRAAFASMIVLLGFFIVVTVYQTTGRVLRDQLDQRASIIAGNFSDRAAADILTQNISELNALITKYAYLDGVAYIFIEDGQGKIVAQSLIPLPTELREASTLDGRQLPNRRVVTFSGRPVHEIRMPIPKGQAGAIHVGIWGDSVDEQIDRVLYPLIGQIALMILAGLVVSVFLARGILRPIRQLTDLADRMSLGDLDTPIGIESKDEIGELARSLERIRASLKAAMVRLASKHTAS